MKTLKQQQEIKCKCLHVLCGSNSVETTLDAAVKWRCSSAFYDDRSPLTSQPSQGWRSLIIKRHFDSSSEPSQGGRWVISKLSSSEAQQGGRWNVSDEVFAGLVTISSWRWKLRLVTDGSFPNDFTSPPPPQEKSLSELLLVWKHMLRNIVMNET